MAGKSWGEYAYLLAIVIAVLAGIAAVFGASHAVIPLLLVILGIVVGFLNISEKEMSAFLIAAVALVVASTVGFGVLDGIIPNLGTLIDAIVSNIAVFAAPAAIISAVKTVHGVASRK